ncbi:MAG: DUF2461 domain-containing protein [Chitinophagaceae bacterium]|jgi:uncharacterized protein (TIGR02453 family)|nr:DUF2461 domain-containing protein [Chitinophagaceae bacterium]
MLQKSTLEFLTQLRTNNNKTWFDAHRQEYQNARADFANFVDNIITEVSKKDHSIQHLKSKDCMFRINRDIRFSKNKEPYKTNFGAFLAAGGKKSPLAGYYFHLEPGLSFAGGGLWMPAAEPLQKVRQEIDYNLFDFKKIIKNKTFKEIYGELTAENGQKLTRVPKGYEADNPAAEYLKFKSFVVMKGISDAELTSENLTKNILKAFYTLQPLIYFLNEGINS